MTGVIGEVQDHLRSFGRKGSNAVVLLPGIWSSRKVQGLHKAFYDETNIMLMHVPRMDSCECMQ